MQSMGFHFDNPGVAASAKLVSVLTNVPLDRVVHKVNNLREAADSQNDTASRIFTTLGWSSWSLGLENENLDEAKAANREEKAKATKKTREEKSEARRIALGKKKRKPRKKSTKKKIPSWSKLRKPSGSKKPKKKRPAYNPAATLRNLTNSSIPKAKGSKDYIIINGKRINL